jgi:nucleotide-binding universal stress UspA family protein
MRSQRGIVVGVDGSYGSARALRRGLHEASRSGCGLTVVHVFPPWAWVEGMAGTGLFAGSEAVDVRVQAAALVQDEIDKALAELDRPNTVRINAETQEGDPGRVLTGMSDKAELLVLGRSGRGHLAGAFLGSAVRYVLHHARCPVMVVPDPGSIVTPWSRVVVGFDGTDQSAATLRWALATARREGCPLHVLHAWNVGGVPTQEALESLESLGRLADGWMRTTATRMLGDTSGVEVTLESVHGPTTASLLSDLDPSDLLVVGARGRGGFRHLLLGSVAAQLSEHAPCVLVVVR